ncbi:MAG: CPBP family intramembrane metalloprotease [Odoribacter sp.]|nr:CPBP family intramembrane metalloprotease [Odoribacter sp.]
MFLEKAFTGNNKWYLYVITTIIVFVAAQIAGIPLALYMIFVNPEAAMQGSITLPATNLGLALALISFVGAFFMLFICVKYIHKKKPLDIVTGRNSFDWKRFFFSAGVWAILTVAVIGITIMVGDTSDIVFQFEPGKFIILCLIAFALLPFQTAWEELMFRGYYMQGFYLLFRSKWGTLILTSLIFGLMHASNPEIKEFGFWVAMPQYILMGFIMGYIALKDDGLEMAIGMHAANNIMAAITFTSDSSVLQTHALIKDLNPTMSHWDTVGLLASGIIFIAICNMKFHFMSKNSNHKNIFQKVFSL